MDLPGLQLHPVDLHRTLSKLPYLVVGSRDPLECGGRVDFAVADGDRRGSLSHANVGSFSNANQLAIVSKMKKGVNADFHGRRYPYLERFDVDVRDSYRQHTDLIMAGILKS